MTSVIGPVQSHYHEGSPVGKTSLRWERFVEKRAEEMVDGRETVRTDEERLLRGRALLLNRNNRAERCMYVMCPNQPCWCSVTYVLWNLWSHSLHGSTGVTSIRIFSHVLFPCPSYNFAQNAISSSVADTDYPPQFSSNSCQYSCKSKKMSMLARD